MDAFKAMSKSAHKRVLVVSYYWPPSGGGGVQRWLKFAKLLPEFGWDPIVVTPSNPDVPVTDPSLSRDVHEGVEVWSFPVWEPTRALSKLGLQGNTSRLGADQSSSPSLASRLVKWVRGNVFVPDARVGWVKPTTRKVLARLRHEPVDLIVTTGPPHSMHLIGLALKRATGLPWVADFRDPWSTMDYLDDFGLGPRARRLIAKMERAVVASADRILVTSPGALQEIGLDDASKGAVIPNGWDRDDFPDNPPAPASNDKPVLGHFGALYGARNAPALWSALGESDWVLKAGGQLSDDVRSNMDQSGVELDWKGDLSHAEAIQAMYACDALVVVHNNSDSAKASTPGKMFECLAAGRPMLVVGPTQGDLEDLCATWGVVFVPHDAPDGPLRIAAWLQHPSPAPDESFRASCERHALAGELAALFNSTIS